tara:strand:- start:3070 stop:4101 length:1032 start_codon:yes stop_codon:yes gene_type:complete
MSVAEQNEMDQFFRGVDMVQEIELKLSLPAHEQPRFAELALLQRYTPGPAWVQRLQNRYFDTPDLQLNAQAVALRVRRQGDQYIQTLKTRGSNQGGLHQRQEWEWPVASDQLDLALLPRNVLPEGMPLEALSVAFNTDFQRSCWILDYPFQEQRASIELVLDSGWVSSQDQRDPISEIELELKSGPTEALFALALELAAELPLRISRISKAEKGYRLRQPERARRIPPAPEIDAAAARFDLNAARHWLERIQALLESYSYIADATLLEKLPASFKGLIQQLEVADAVPQGLVTDLLAQQQQVVSLLSQLDPPSPLQQWLDSQALGLCLLRFSYWLYLQPESAV